MTTTVSAAPSTLPCSTTTTTTPSSNAAAAYRVENRRRISLIQTWVLMCLAIGMVLPSSVYPSKWLGYGGEGGGAIILASLPEVPSLMPVVGASAVTMGQFVDTFPGLRTLITGKKKKKHHHRHTTTTSATTAPTTATTTTTDVPLPHLPDGQELKKRTSRNMVVQVGEDGTTLSATTTTTTSASSLLFLIFLDLILIGLGATFAGLTLAVMGLDTLSLEILSTSGTEPDKTYATNILPVRRLGNQLLCTLLLGNVMVITGVSQVTAQMLDGWQATLVSTVLICLGAEIIPQAAMSAHALAVGSRSTTLVKFFVFIFYPLCKPCGMFLDVVVGSDPGQIYERNELKNLMLKHVAHSHESGLGKSDLDLMVGAMELREKTVLSAMTPLADVYMLETHERITEDLLTMVSEKGHSRIPVYRGNRNNVVGVLHAKDLLMARPEDNAKVSTLIAFYQRKFHVVPSESKLISILRHFQTGRTHISLVQEVRFRSSMPSGGTVENDEGNNNTTNDGGEGNNGGEGEGDPYYEVLGIITLEDVVEEVLHAEIFDEHDLQAFRRNAEEYGSAESLYGDLLWQNDGDALSRSPGGNPNSPLIKGGPLSPTSHHQHQPLSKNLTMEAAHYASVSLRLYHTFHRSHRRIHLSLNQLAATAYFLQRNIPELAACSSQQLLKALTKGGNGRLDNTGSGSGGEQAILGGPFCTVMRVKVPKDAAGFEWPTYKRVAMKSPSGDSTTTATVLDNNHNALLYVAGSPLHATLPPKDAIRYCAFRLQHQPPTGTNGTNTASVNMSGASPSTLHLSGCMTLVISGRVEAASRGERASAHPLPTNTTYPNTTKSMDLVTSGSGVGNNTGLVAELPSWSIIGADSMRNGVTVTANGTTITDTNAVEYTCRVVQDALLLQITTAQFLGLKNYLNI